MSSDGPQQMKDALNSDWKLAFISINLIKGFYMCFQFDVCSKSGTRDPTSLRFQDLQLQGVYET